MEKIDDEYFKLSTGKVFYANNLIIGIDDKLRVFEGYDGTIDYHEDYFTKQEREELADYMIGLWNKYKDKV